jgi:hypothetical protein
MMNMNFGSAVLVGFAATLVLTTVSSTGRSLGLTRMDIPYILGTFYTDNRNKAGWLGFFMHLVNGWVFALLYIALMEQFHLKHWWAGMLMGLFQAGFLLTLVVQLMPRIHPRMASEERGPEVTRQLEPPGAFALNYGRQTPIVVLVTHLIYGGMLGMFYT